MDYRVVITLFSFCQIVHPASLCAISPGAFLKISGAMVLTTARIELTKKTAEVSETFHLTLLASKFNNE